MDNVAFITSSLDDSFARLYPLFQYRKRLEQMGVSFSVFYDLDPISQFKDFNHLFISSCLYHHLNFDLNTLERLAKLDRKIYWLDELDSTMAADFEVLPYVHKYLKRKLVKDKSLYAKQWYRGSLYADYYHHEYGLYDPSSWYMPTTTLQLEYADKLGVFWNIAYFDNFLVWPFIESGYKRTPIRDRAIDIFARMTVDDYTPTISFQRKQCMKMLSQFEPKHPKIAYKGKLHPLKYLEEIVASKLVVSPFGLGCPRLSKNAVLAKFFAQFLAPVISH